MHALFTLATLLCCGPPTRRNWQFSLIYWFEIRNKNSFLTPNQGCARINRLGLLRLKVNRCVAA